MSYSSNIPQATSIVSDTQEPILNNFQTIETAFNLNHGNFNDPTQGKHKFMQMPAQTDDPPVATNEGTLFTKLENNIVQLFFSYMQGDDRRNVNIIAGTPTQTMGNNNYSWILPGGLHLNFGIITIPSNRATPTSLTFNTPFASQAYIALLTGKNVSGAGEHVTNLTVQTISISQDKDKVLKNSTF